MNGGKAPLVSVIVPTYNQGHYLRQALDSVMFQDYPEIEIIISNFGSTDGTSDIIRDYLNTVKTEHVDPVSHMAEDGTVVRLPKIAYPQNRSITVLDSTENIGGTAAYNEGFRRATGTYCMYLVGDDYLLPNALSELVPALETGVDVAYADMFVVNDQGHILHHLEKPDYDFAACFAQWFHLGVCRLYRREWHDRLGFYSTDFRNANDYDFMLRLAEAGALFKRVPKVLYCTRIHEKSGEGETANWRDNGYENLLRESKECAQRARNHLSRTEAEDER